MSDIPITPGLLEAELPAQSQGGWLEWIATIDHKRIGILWHSWIPAILQHRRTTQRSREYGENRSRFIN
jgi:hypothetical protein